jgi:hypothetical protein
MGIHLLNAFPHLILQLSMLRCAVLEFPQALRRLFVAIAQIVIIHL